MSWWKPFAYVISPYIKHGSVNHGFYNTDSLLKTMEMLLGLPPLTQYDAIASPIDDFDNHPSNDSPYAVIEPSSDIICQKTPPLSVFKRGDPMRKWALESAKMDFDHPDSAPATKLNRILWKSVKRASSPMPRPRHTIDSESDKD